MSAESVAFSRSWRVGKYTATLSSPAPVAGQTRSALIEWDPRMPERLTASEMRQYKAGRDAAALELARRSGINLVMVDL